MERNKKRAAIRVLRLAQRFGRMRCFFGKEGGPIIMNPVVPAMRYKMHDIVYRAFHHRPLLVGYTVLNSALVILFEYKGKYPNFIFRRRKKN